jgi:MFS family permease
VRATGSSVLALFQNLFGLAAGPFLVGLLSDRMGLQPALAAVPLASVIAAAAFLLAARSYEGDKARAAEPIETTPRTKPAVA